MDFFSSDAEASKLLNDLDWDKWFYSPGLPPKPDFDTSLVDVVYELARKWQTLPESGFTPKESDIKGLMANQIVVFLEQILLFEKPLTPDQSRLMGEVYGIAKSENVEVANLYLQVGLKAGDRSVIEPTTELLGRIGRMKFVRPLYVDTYLHHPSPPPKPIRRLSMYHFAGADSIQVSRSSEVRPCDCYRDVREEQGFLPSDLPSHGGERSLWQERRLRNDVIIISN